jgi:hypothetical protein
VGRAVRESLKFSSFASANDNQTLAQSAHTTCSLHVLFAVSLNHLKGRHKRREEKNGKSINATNKLIKRHKHGIYAGLSEKRTKRRGERGKNKTKRQNCELLF